MRQRRGHLGKKKNVITYGWDELIYKGILRFCMKASETHSRTAEWRSPFDGRQRGLSFTESGYHQSKKDRVQVTHQQNTVGFLYGLLTCTKRGTCGPSLQADGAQTLPANWPLFGVTFCKWARLTESASRVQRIIDGVDKKKSMLKWVADEFNCQFFIGYIMALYLTLYRRWW